MTAPGIRVSKEWLALREPADAADYLKRWCTAALRG